MIECLAMPFWHVWQSIGRWRVAFALLFMLQFLSSLAIGRHDESNALLCSDGDLRFGQWVSGAANCGLKDHYVAKVQSDFDFSKDNFYRREQKPRVLEAPFPWAQWCWKPLCNHAKPFSREGFCRKMKGKRMLFVGDSLVLQTYTALYYQLGEEGTLLHQHYITHSSHALKNDNWGRICNGSSHLYFIRNDHLTVTNEGSRPSDISKTRSQTLDAEWKSLLPFTDYVIMNEGHHTNRKEVSDGNLWLDNLRLIEYLKLNVNYTRTQVIFMTTSYGHPACAKHSKPVMTPLVDQAQYEKLVNKYIRHISNLNTINGDTMKRGWDWGW